MMGLIIVIHVIVCIALIALVLIQRGRGSGLVESFAGVESLFGTKTSTFLTKATTVLSSIFFLTCLSLAVLSMRQSKSLMSEVKIPSQAKEIIPQAAVANQTAAAAAAPAQNPTDSPVQNSTQL